MRLILLLTLLLLTQLAALESRTIPPIDRFIGTTEPLSTMPKFIGPRHYFTYQLWTTATPWSYADKLAIRVIALRRFPLEKAVREMVEEAVELHAVDEEIQGKLTKLLSGAFGTDFAIDDQVDFCWNPAIGMAIYRNGVLRAATDDRALARLVLDFFAHEEERGSALLEHKQAVAE